MNFIPGSVSSRIFLSIVLWLCSLSVLPALAETVNRDPRTVKLVVLDIANFWKAYDNSKPGQRGRVLQQEYLDRGSVGLTDFLKLRIGSADSLAGAIDKHQGYYAAIRQDTLSVPRYLGPIRTAFEKFKALYPDAEFPDVYFVVGRMDSAGTVSDHGMLIGTEMMARPAQLPEEELNDWERNVLQPIDQLPGIVAHELIHIQQKYDEPKTLLGQTIREGSADFLGELISGQKLDGTKYHYGAQHERQLWEDFQQEMNGKDVKRWLYNGVNSNGRPADLGYVVGYRIVKSYYDRALDKRQAIREILQISNFENFLKKSSYTGRELPVL